MSITLLLIVVTAMVSWQALNNEYLFTRLKHYPYLMHRNKEIYRLISSGFVHGSMLHLGVNMFVLFQFGEVVENTFIQIFGAGLGRINFFFLYLLAIVFGDLPTYFKHRGNAYFSSVGASGAVSAIIFAFVLFYPWSELRLFFIIPCPAIVAAVLYLIYSSWASRNQNDLIDHDAHFYGAIFGLLFTIALRPVIFQYFIHQLTSEFPF